MAKKRTEQYPDLPMRYMRKNSKQWQDTYSGEIIPNNLIHTKTKGYIQAQQQKIMDARWDLKID